MSPQEVRSARECLYLTHEQLAADYGVTEAEVRYWEDVAGAIPRRHAAQLAWDAALRRREEALAASGIPVCPWLRDVEDRMPEDPKRMDAWLGMIQAHVDVCETCHQRSLVARQLPPLPDPPMPEWMRVFHQFLNVVDWLPRWARPAAYGAVLVGTISLVRSILLLLETGPSLAAPGMVAMGIGTGACLGAVAGIVYYSVRGPLKRCGRAGPYLTGIAVVVACFLAFALPDHFLAERPILVEPVGWVIALWASVLFGLAIGHFWFRVVEETYTTGTGISPGA